MSDIQKRLAALPPEKRELLLRKLGKAAPAPRATIAPRPRGGSSFPLSFTQQRLWFLDQLEPGSAFYNVPSVVKLTGPLEVDALAKSFRALVCRHESLRTTFRTGVGGPEQIISTESVTALRQEDLSHLPATDREAVAQRWAQEEARRPFSLEQGPLLRTTLVKLSEQESVLVLVMHHIVSDGWSMGIIVS